MFLNASLSKTTFPWRELFLKLLTLSRVVHSASYQLSCYGRSFIGVHAITKYTLSLRAFFRREWRRAEGANIEPKILRPDISFFFFGQDSFFFVKVTLLCAKEIKMCNSACQRAQRQWPCGMKAIKYQGWILWIKWSAMHCNFMYQTVLHFTYHFKILQM